MTQRSNKDYQQALARKFGSQNVRVNGDGWISVWTPDPVGKKAIWKTFGRIGDPFVEKQLFGK